MHWGDVHYQLKKKMESRPLRTPLCWKQKLLVSCKKMPECVQAPFSWWPDTGLLQVLKGGISPDYSPAAPLLWQQQFLIFFPFCIIFVPLQPPTKRINHTTIINTAGQRVLVVGVVLAEGTSGPSPTVLQFTVNIPKTGFFNFILRYKVRLQSRLVCVFASTADKCTLSSDGMIDLPFTCTFKPSLIKQPPQMGRFNGCPRKFIHRGSLPLKDFLKQSHRFTFWKRLIASNF